MSSIKKNYYTDPEYKKRHLKYMSTKIPCSDGCGTITARYNMHHHRKCYKHIKFITNNTLTQKMIDNAKIEIDKYLNSYVEKIKHKKYNVQCLICDNEIDINLWKKHCKCKEHKNNVKIICGENAFKYNYYDIKI
jgi:ribosomal protein L2